MKYLKFTTDSFYTLSVNTQSRLAKIVLNYFETPEPLKNDKSAHYVTNLAFYVFLRDVNISEMEKVLIFYKNAIQVTIDEN